MLAFIRERTSDKMLKESWISLTPDWNTLELQKEIKFFENYRPEELSIQKAAKKICEELNGNRILVDGLTYALHDDGTVFVYELPICIESFKEDANNYYLYVNSQKQAKLRKLVKKVCEQIKRPIIIAKENNSNWIGYDLRGGKICVDGDYIVDRRFGYMVIEFNPIRAKNLKEDPRMTFNKLHRMALLSVTELRAVVFSLRADIECSKPLKNLAQFIQFCSPKKPIREFLMKMVMDLIPLYKLMVGNRSYRSDPIFKEFIKAAKEVFLCWKYLKVPKHLRVIHRMFKKFMEKEIKITEWQERREKFNAKNGIR